MHKRVDDTQGQNTETVVNGDGYCKSVYLIKYKNISSSVEEENPCLKKCDN